ncbi:T9SS type A sorting domain-containing protein [Dysgonomonas sp. 520]|uniref:leucine-rich repeat domain-containing protein n=1 Tax=Dysgonomonas sp. 520 TaxID=2302931 RepID=UPI0013D4DE44|nr:T9SS type A sorting domain-containing protein [Dysgonomonas sp. 520]NDW09674.1 hypothetical protein [Dysgonomonas sp. 520]
MKKRLLTFLLCLGFISLTTITKAQDVIKLTSTATSEMTFGLGVSTIPTVVSIDWGNGTFVDYTVDKDGSSASETFEATGTPSGTGEITIKGVGITAFDCDFNLETPEVVTALDVTGAVNLTRLTCVSQSISTLDLSYNTALTRLVINNTKNKNLTTLKLKDNAALTYLNCSGNNLTAINVEDSPLLDYLNVSDNNISSIDYSKNTVVRDLYLQNNKIATLDDSVWPSLTKLRTLNVSGNLLTSLVGTDAFAAKTSFTFNCSKNYLNIATLPQPGSLSARFNYAPQAAYEIPESIQENAELDLSSQNNVKGVLATPVATTYTWTTESGTALVVNDDYTEADGKFTFLKPQTEKVVCSMTTTAFPKFTGDNVFKTTPMAVLASTGIGEGVKDAINIYARENILYINGLNGYERINVINLQGVSVYSTIAAGAEISTELPSGIYIVSVDGNASKVIIK